MNVALRKTVTVQPPFDLENVRVLPGDDHEVRLYPSAKRVRVFFGDVVVAESIRVQLMRESGRLPVYYFPAEDVRMELLTPSTRAETSLYKGPAQYFSVVVGDRVAPDAAWRYITCPPSCPDLSGLIAFYWRSMDAWFEEDEQVYGHPRDPFRRIDILQSTRHVEVRDRDTLLADTRRARMLFETKLPTRYYIPRHDVRLELLTPSAMVTACAYKGQTSEYWSHDSRDVAWSYAEPNAEVGAIAGMVAFFNERVDIAVDGVPQPRPQTPWS